MIGLIFSLLLSLYGLILIVKEYGNKTLVLPTVYASKPGQDILLGLFCIILIFYPGSHFLLIGLIIFKYCTKIHFIKFSKMINFKSSRQGIRWTVTFIKFWPVIFIFSMLSFFFFQDYPLQSNVNQLRGDDTNQIISIIISSLIIAPIIEEIVFRKFLYTGFKSTLGIGISAISSSFIFALIHLNIFSFIVLFIFGLFLCYCYEKYNTIYAPIWIHFMFNLFMVLSILAK